MSECGHDMLMLHALVDGELDAAHAAEVEARLRTCPDCAAEHAHLMEFRGAVRAAALRRAAPDRLRSRIQADLSRPAVRSAPIAQARPWAWMGGGAGLALAACAALFLVGQQIGESQVLADALIASHVRSLQVAHLTDVQTSDQHVVKPWFSGKLDFSPPVIDLKDQGFPLVGGRLDYVGERPVAAIVYRRGRHTVNLFVWPAGAADPAAEALSRRGFGLRHWRSGGLAFWAVSDVNPLDLAQFETELKARTGG
jgi:anti-sigma factor RsiW